MKPKNQICTLDIAADIVRAETPDCVTRRRLERGFALLQNLQLVRAHRQEPRFGRTLEQRIVWRELIDLELYEIDEQIERTSASASENAQ